MKKRIAVLAMSLLLAVSASMPAMAGAVTYGNSTTTTASTDGHWGKRNGKWDFIDNQDGHVYKGWIVSGMQWYYMGPQEGNGAMYTGWQNIGEQWYYLSEAQVSGQPLGSLYMNRLTPDGYHVDASGIWVD